jgi:hypothetical protein
MNCWSLKYPKQNSISPCKPSVRGYEYWLLVSSKFWTEARQDSEWIHRICRLVSANLFRDHCYWHECVLFQYATQTSWLQVNGNSGSGTGVCVLQRENKPYVIPCVRKLAQKENSCADMTEFPNGMSDVCWRQNLATLQWGNCLHRYIVVPIARWSTKRKENGITLQTRHGLTTQSHPLLGTQQTRPD